MKVKNKKAKQIKFCFFLQQNLSLHLFLSLIKNQKKNYKEHLRYFVKINLSPKSYIQDIHIQIETNK